MDVKKVILIVTAMIVALGAAFGVNKLMRGNAAPEARAAAAPVATGPQVLVATRALPVGTILTRDALRYQAWPEGLVKPEEYYLEGQSQLESLVGSVVRVAVTTGSPVTKGALVNPGDRGFLASALGPGMRAITVPLSADQGVAGFVFPGDRVDILLSQSVKPDQGSEGQLFTSETILRNVRVLAVDQRTVPSTSEGQTTPEVFGTATLEVTPQIAEAIAVARTSGGVLSLALRSIADNTAELEQAIASGTVSVPRNGDPTAEERMLRGMASRPTLDRGQAMTGGDVSRYLRRGFARVQTAPSYAGPPSAADAAVAAGAGRAAAPAAPSGPSVRVVRGDQVTVVPVGR